MAGKAHANDRMSEKENVLVKIIITTKRYRKVKKIHRAIK
jgi:hypothetical protein